LKRPTHHLLGLGAVRVLLVVVDYALHHLAPDVLHVDQRLAQPAALAVLVLAIRLLRLRCRSRGGGGLTRRKPLGLTRDTRGDTVRRIPGGCSLASATVSIGNDTKEGGADMRRIQEGRRKEKGGAGPWPLRPSPL